MIVKKKIHYIWNEIQKTKPKFKHKIIGKYQYLFSSKKGKISLIKIYGTYQINKGIWEIYCLKGNLFDDILRFKSKENAIKKIKDFLK